MTLFDEQKLLNLEALYDLDAAFLQRLAQEAPGCAAFLKCYRQTGFHCPENEQSQWLIACAEHLDRFIAQRFDIEAPAQALRAHILKDNPVFVFKKEFVLKNAKRQLKEAARFSDFETLDHWLKMELVAHDKRAAFQKDPEWAVATLACGYLAQAEQYHASIEKLTQWCVQAWLTPEGQRQTKGWVSFHFPLHRDFSALIPLEAADEVRVQMPAKHWRARDGFHLTDLRMTSRQVQNEIHYCVYCHKNAGDFCSRGFPVKKDKPELGLKTNPLGEILTGCPLEEKISEMHTLKAQGDSIGALAMVMLDNPMCPATGHRICNDCMKACIYQKQDPVNIPEIETRVLTDVLNLPWGVEIYDLLTRWNPLRAQQYLPKPYNGKKVLVMGMGPAGFTLAHHLLMEGFAVVGMDGLKIEPLPTVWKENPIRDYQELQESLDARMTMGFGGVAEYGITVRWDKNFLKLIYLTLSRRPYFQVLGNVRFGGTLHVEDAWALGFHHLALAVGAGLPRELRIPNSLAPGMRQANDFLMALQLTGAARESSLANLQIRLPAVVIGGGLTGVDAATELQAYYVRQVEKTLRRFEALTATQEEAVVWAHFDAISAGILQEFLKHGRAIREERERAEHEKREPFFLPLLHRWGGVTIIYRRELQASPAYRHNPEELAKALEEGIYYAPQLQPVEVLLDENGQSSGLRCLKASQEPIVLPARTILVATGATPNIAYEYEHKGTFSRNKIVYDNFEFQRSALPHVDFTLEKVEEALHCKQPLFGPFTSYAKAHHLVSFVGDTHPVFHGSVVKAIASAKRSYPKIVEALQKIPTPPKVSAEEYLAFAALIRSRFSAHLYQKRELKPGIWELKIKAPQAAAKGAPGQFYRLQNFESFALHTENLVEQAEGVALIGAQVDADPTLLTFFLMERGVSSKIVSQLPVGAPIALMGPTGVRYLPPQVPATVMIIGGAMAVAYLYSIAPLLKAQGIKIIFIGCFSEKDAVFCPEQLHAFTDQTMWIVPGDLFTESTGIVLRPQDCHLNATGLTVLPAHIESMRATLADCQHVLVIDDATALRDFKHQVLPCWSSHLPPTVKISAAVFGPMQCMLKGVCAQCLQWQVDPKTGERSKAVYSCSWQQQPIELIDIGNISERLEQNRCQETLTGLWYEACK